MGCFLACFGYSKKQRRKSGNKITSGDQLQGHGSYEPLQPDVTATFNITEKPITSDSEFRDKPKDRLSFRIRKKVSFNLNVKTYEPIANDEAIDYFSEDKEKGTWEKNEEEIGKSSISVLNSEGNSAASRMGSYPSNYRYQNCGDNYDEEDEIKLEESDLDEDDIGDTDDEEDGGHDSDYDGGHRTSLVESLEQCYCLSTESSKKVTFAQLAKGKTNNLALLRALPDQEVKKLELNHNVRDRSQYVYSVLNPVENLTQWKAVKARETPPLKHQKENIAIKQEQIALNSMPSFNQLASISKSNSNQSKPLMHEFAVDASLSNWLGSSKKETITKSSTNAIAAMSSKKNMLDGSNSHSRENGCILRNIKSHS